ncbi:MAG: hypothetical protein H0T11_09480 [Chthoniobacterales bacterium]|nr:hypothetical protein [Chthoniobacterales bacterium]
MAKRQKVRGADSREGLLRIAALQPRQRLLACGQLGNAILSYERAQLLAPNEPDIAANLSLARKQAGLFVDQSSWIQEAARFFTLNAWAWIGTGALVVLCALVGASQMYRRQRLYLRLFTGVAALALCAAAVFVALQLETLDRAVVTSKEAIARISPFESAKSAFVLSAGEVVDVERVHGNFLLVENRERRTSWISKEQIERVVPDAGQS